MSDNTLRLEDSSTFYIETPMVKELHDRMTHWAWCGATGGVIVGESRCGKTVAIRALSDHIESRSAQKIPVFRINYGNRDQKTIRGALHRVALSLYETVKKTLTADNLTDMICTKLAEASLSNEARQVILVVDESQFLTIEQLSAFAEIYNILFEVRVNCIVFFVANEDTFEPLAQRLADKENTYIRERFFNNVFHYYGIRNADELKKCLQAFDRKIVDPESKITAPERFCPHLYEKGWRLESLAKVYWHHYCELYKIPLKHKSFRMNQFINVTNILLMDYLPNCPDITDQEYMEASIIKSLAAASIAPDIVKYVS